MKPKGHSVFDDIDNAIKKSVPIDKKEVKRKIEEVALIVNPPPTVVSTVRPAKSSITDDIKDDIIRGAETKTDLANTCELLLNEKWRKRKTRLRERSIPALSTLETLSDIYDVKWLRAWIDAYTEYVTSEDGKGRQEIVDIAKYSIDKETTMRREMLDVMGKR